jgi:diguanylate cyclase (GGDEF)-like protein/PAS domain S-box-containing protein
VGALLGGDGGPADRTTIDTLAAEVNALCPLDRSVQATLHAIRALAEAQAGEVTATVLDLCDAIRSCQLQRRMAEYVALKRLQTSHYFIGNTLLGRDRSGLRSLDWLVQTHAQAGVLALWSPSGQSDRLSLAGVFERNGRTGTAPAQDTVHAVEAFPPAWLLRPTGDQGWLVVITQVRFEDNDWGLLAVAGDRSMQSAVVQASFHQWAVLMSTSLAQEKANADLARQAAELAAAYDTQMALLEEVRVSEERYALAAEAAQGAVWDWSIDTGHVYYSSRWKALIGHRDNEVGVGPDEWLGRIHPDDTAQVREHLDGARTGANDFLDFEHRLRTSTGEYRWIACTGRSVLDPDGRVHRLVGSFTDVTARRLLQEQLEQEALFDGLTGLAKATLFKDRLDEAIAQARNCADYRFAILYIDLNGFKEVNDALGHAVGDELLASLGQRLNESLRRTDLAARLGGDEFGVLINDVSHLSELPPIVERAVALITAPYLIGNRTLTVGASIGVAVSDTGYPTADAMLHEADAAMYRAKRRSREHAPDTGAFVAVIDDARVIFG